MCMWIRTGPDVELFENQLAARLSHSWETTHHYSLTQNSIATSSAAAELYAIGSGAAEGLGIMNFLRETCLTKKGQLLVLTDFSSAKSISTRMGTSNLTKHIELHVLFIQDLVQAGGLKVRKVPTVRTQLM